MKSISEHSSGGSVYKRDGKSRLLWLVSKHSGYHKWVLPKGIIEDGETAGQAALREVLEETGIEAKIVKKVEYEVRYQYKKGDVLVDKHVEFFLMEYVGGDIKNHSWEMEDVRWVSFDKAIKLLGFEGEKEALREAKKLVSLP